MTVETIDQIQLRFSPTGLAVINTTIGLMMFGMALDMRWADFKSILLRPKAPAIGLIAQSRNAVDLLVVYQFGNLLN